MKNEFKTIVLADYENEQEYKEIKGASAFPTIFEHRQALRNAVNECRSQDYLPEIVTCDKKGYYEFLKKNSAENSQKSIEAYIVAKYNGKLDEPAPELRYQNIESARV
ncbi:MAG: hypothetical protein E7053_10950 [Lentisphaerae bacterium]|nr:hypothetical protein [Lentisphaerota bacterium]